jgi:hypothetical protein
MKRRITAVLLVISLVIPIWASAQVSTKQYAARTELHFIPSMTLSDEQFLKGESGKQSSSQGCCGLLRDRAVSPLSCCSTVQSAW